MSKTYAERKEEVRNEAIEWQYYYFCDPAPAISYGELFEWESYFEKLGRRYGLLEEFRENGIC